MSFPGYKREFIKILRRGLDDDDHDDDHEEDHSDHDDHDDHDEHDDHSIDPDVFKVIMMILMFLCVGFGVIPKVWSKCRDNDEILSKLNCFASGMFLAMSLIHMMPEAVEIYTTWAVTEGIERAFPLPYVMFFLGYFLILAVDRVAA